MVTTIDSNLGNSGDSRSSIQRIAAYGQVGQWSLVIGPHSIRHVMMNLIAGLAEQEPVRVLDGGASLEERQLGWLEVAHLLRNLPNAIDRVSMRQAFSCYEMLFILENTASTAVPFVVLDLLKPFYDESVKIGERKRLLRGCLKNLGRLEKYAGGMVSVSPPMVRSRESVGLFKMVEGATTDSYRREIMLPSPDLQRLFSNIKKRKK